MFEPDIVTYIIVLPLCFATGILNASSGGGGIISLSAFLIAGLPPHLAIGTNKLQAFCGLAVAVARYGKNGLITTKLIIPTVLCAIGGSFIGAHLSLMMHEEILLWVMVLILPIITFFTFRKSSFVEDGETSAPLDKRMYLTTAIVSFVVGCYDGFYGPGSGVFLIIGFTVICHLATRRASAQAKVINLATNGTAGLIFLINGQTLILLGLIAGACNVLGAWLGAGLIIKNGAKAMKPLIIIALVLLAIKIVSQLF